MIVYSGTKAEFKKEVRNNTIADTINERILIYMGHHTPVAEYTAWTNSLAQMYFVLDVADIPEDAGIAIEYNIPQTSKRVDFIISGYDKSGESSAVIVELKQWSAVKKVNGYDAIVETQFRGGMSQVVHPSYQAYSYFALIKDYNATVQDEHINLAPCAFLHNYRKAIKDDPLFDAIYSPWIKAAPLFTSGKGRDLSDFISHRIKKGDRAETIKKIEGGKIRPSKRLQDVVGSMLKGNPEFVMIDEQKYAYEVILKAAEESKKTGMKQTIIVQGGPGTGKSVIALNLLSELTKRGEYVKYASKNSAPRSAYKVKIKTSNTTRRVSINNLFCGTGSFYKAKENEYDTILADEAHRMTEKSDFFGHGENQIKEVINASLCSVFFIDESQRVTFNDIGSVEEIKFWAKENNSKLVSLSLTSQFRCDGSDGYLAWLDDALQIRETANYSLKNLDYDFKVFDDPNVLRDAIVALNEKNHNSRLLAGYCWDWDTQGRKNPDYADIKIGSFKASWNLNEGVFAVDDFSINQVGCIHTSQGLEFAYVGVIIGPDLKCQEGKIVTDYKKRAKTDSSLHGLGKIMRQDEAEGQRIAEELIKNTYRTLMTRGMKGCYIYCTDEALNAYFKRRLEFKY